MNVNIIGETISGRKVHIHTIKIGAYVGPVGPAIATFPIKGSLFRKDGKQLLRANSGILWTLQGWVNAGGPSQDTDIGVGPHRGNLDLVITNKIRIAIDSAIVDALRTYKKTGRF